MKGLGKKIIVFALALALVCTSGIPVLAASTGNTKLIKKADTVAGYTQVTKDSTATFTLKVKREDDEFNMYQLTKVSWAKSTDGIDVVTVEWIQEVQDFINNDPTFSTATFKSADRTTKNIYTTPENLGEAEDTTADGVYVADSKVNETYVIELLKAIRKDSTVMAALKANYIVGYHGDPYDNTNNPATPADSNSTYVAADAAPGEPGKANVVATYAGSDPASVFQYSYTVDKMPVGLCFVDAKSGPRTYQPVLLDLMPIQVGPTGNWYVKNTQSYSLKYEDASISKKINGAAYDIVRDGEIVSFEIRVDIPKYQKNADSNYVSTMVNVFDEMTQGFTLLPASAKFTFYNEEKSAVYSPASSLTAGTDKSVTINDTEQATYSARLADNAYVYYSTTDDKNVFYGTPVTGGTQVQFWGEVDGVLEPLGSYNEGTNAYTTVLNAYNNKLAAANKTALSYTGANIAKRGYTLSLISLKMDYTKLMDNVTIDSQKFEADHLVITYDAVVNTNAYVGTDDNTNDVFLYYIGDSAGNQYISQATVKAWTYAANLVKVDGSTYQTTQKTDTNGNPMTDADGNPVYKEPTYLDGAVFDLYRLDSIYCGGDAATAAPTETDYSGYGFYSDANGNTYTDSRNAWLGKASENYKDGTIYKAVSNYYNADTATTDKATAISNAMTAIAAATEDYNTLDKCKNKYGAYNSYKTIFNSYLLPEVRQMTTQYVPVEVEFCSDHPGKHYHVQVYTVFWNDITSTDTADGITLTGLDPNTYLLVETMAPSGYHKLSNALQFEINQYDTTKANQSGSITYKGFIDDESNDVTDGIYDIVVQNFAGLVLPSTGGMGTLLFTIIGIMVMLGTIVIIGVKSKKRQSLGIY